MATLLDSEELAEIQQRHGEYAHIEETQGFAPWIDRQAEIDREDLLYHIETREMEVKAALQWMIRPAVSTSLDYASRMRDLYHNQEVRVAAAQLNITLD
jgi:hypothetical protein